MNLEDRGNKDYRRGFDDGLRRCRSILEQGERAMRVDLEHREEALRKGLAALEKERGEWEEYKARYVLEQLKLIRGG